MSPRRPPEPTWIRIAERVYSAALLLFPARFRNDYGACLRQAFRDRCREVANGKHHAFRVLALELAPDLVTSLGRERMQAGFEGLTLRHTLLMGCLGLAFAGLVGRDAVAPPVLDATVSIRNRVNDFIDLRRIQAREATTRRIAERLAAAPDAGSKALAALLYRSIAQRKEHPFYFPDDQSESMYHRPPERADAENTWIRQLADDVMRDRNPGAFALTRAAESCEPRDGCGRGRLIARLAQADAGNGYAWTLAFIDADARDDEAGRRNALGRLALADRYDTREGEIAARLFRAADAVGLGNDQTTTTLVRQMVEARLMDDLSAPVNYCVRHSTRVDGDTSSIEPGVATDCYRAFERMAGSSRLGPSLIGWHLLVRLNRDPALDAQARAALRDRYWLAGTRFTPDSLETGSGQFRSATDAARWRAAFHAGEGEIPALRRWFIARGLPAHAPARYFVPEQYLAPRLNWFAAGWH